MNYPRKLYANVLLCNGKIINWKTGTRSWENNKWLESRQPLKFILNEDNIIESKVISETVYNGEENSLFFEKTSIEFYKQFEIHEDYLTDTMFEPY